MLGAGGSSTTRWLPGGLGVGSHRDAQPALRRPLRRDIVYVPEARPQWHAVEVGGANSFVAKPVTVTVRAILRGPSGKPLANKSVTTTPASEEPLKTDGDGQGGHDVDSEADDDLRAKVHSAHGC